MTEKTIYTFTDDGSGVPSQLTDLSCSDGGGVRCSGTVSCTPANPTLGDVIVCTVPGPARLLMLVGPADVSFNSDDADESSGSYAEKGITLLRFPVAKDTSAGAGLKVDEGKLFFIGRGPSDTHCIPASANSACSTIVNPTHQTSCDPQSIGSCAGGFGAECTNVVDGPEADCTGTSDDVGNNCVWTPTNLCKSNSRSTAQKEQNRNIISITKVPNTGSRNVICGANKILTGSIYLNNLAAQTKGLYIGGCSAALITAIDDRTWDVNGVANSLITLNLDDTNFVTPPSLAKLVNLERLSIAGDVKDGLMTSLPDITALTALKYFNISKHAGITTIPAGYFDSNVLLEEIVLHGNGLTTLPDDIFKFNVKLRVIDIGGNQLTVAILKNSLFETLPLLTHVDLSDNSFVVNEANPLVSTLFDNNVRLSHVYLQGNSMKFLSHLQFQHNLLLSLIAMGGASNGFRSITVCPTGYYRTQVFMPSIETGQAVYYGCDLCSMGGTDAYSW